MKIKICEIYKGFLFAFLWAAILIGILNFDKQAFHRGLLQVLGLE